MYKVVRDRLHKGKTPVEYRETPNKGRRIVPRYIVLHDTCGYGHGRGSIAWLTNPASRASAHLVIAEDGTITQLADFDVRTWHAGPSSWDGLSGLNGYSIGIEMANPGLCYKRGKSFVRASGGTKVTGDVVHHPKTQWHPDGYWQPYSKQQMAALLSVIKALGEAYPTIEEVIGHHQIDTRKWKVDPSPLMPWDEVHAVLQGVAMPVEPAVSAVPRAEVRQTQARLNGLGYAAGDEDGKWGPRSEQAMKAFEVQNKLPEAGAITPARVEAVSSESAKEMPRGSREEITSGEMSDRSRTYSNGLSVERLGVVQGVMALVLSIVAMFHDLFEQVAQIGLTGATLLVACGLGGWAAWSGALGFRIRKTREADHKEARHVG